MKTDWTKNLKTEEEKQELENYLRGSNRLLERLSQILTEYERSLDRSEIDQSVYDKPNWRERQAHKNGYRACLYKIKELIDLKE